MTELVKRPERWMVPLTGEVVELTDPTDVLVRRRADAREIAQQLQEYTRVLDNEVIARMDAEKVWTVHADGLKATAPSNAPVEIIDAEGLWFALSDLVEAGELTTGAMLRAVSRTEEYRVSKRGLDALRKGGGALAQLIDRFITEERKDRRLRVEVDR